MCRDLVYDVLQRDEQSFVWQCGATESIVQQTLGINFFTAIIFSTSLIFPNRPSYLFVSLMTIADVADQRCMRRASV